MRRQGNPVRIAQGSAVGERRDGLRRLRAGGHVGTQGSCPDVVRREPQPGFGLLRLCGVLPTVALGADGATGGRAYAQTTPRPHSRQPKQLDAGIFQAEISSFALRLAAEGKAAKTIQT